MEPGATPVQHEGPPVPGAPRVTLYSRPGCHLCDDARGVIEAVTAEAGESFAEVDITTDPLIHDRYWQEIPVTLVDGRRHDFFFVSAERLRAALAEPRPTF